MAERGLHRHPATGADRRDFTVLLRETGRKVIVFSLACLLAWGIPAFRAGSQGKSSVTLMPSEVERSFIERAPLYHQRALAYPAPALAESYFSETYSVRELPRLIQGGVRSVITLSFGRPQRITKDNVDAYIDSYSGLLSILTQAIRQRGFRHVGGTFVMSAGPSCAGFNNGTVLITQSDFKIKLVDGWPAAFDRLARAGGSAHFQGVIIDDTIAVGALGVTEEMFGLGKVEAGRIEINFGNCRVMLTPQIGPSVAAPP